MHVLQLKVIAIITRHFDRIVAEIEKSKSQYSELERLDVKLREVSSYTGGIL